MNGRYDQPGDPGYSQQDGYGDQGDGSFLPGFGRRDEFDGGRPAERGRGNEGYTGYDDRRAPRGAGPRDPGGRGPGGPGGPAGGPGGPGGRGPGSTGPRDRGDGRRNYDDWDDPRRDPRHDPRRRKTRWIPRVLLLVIALAIVGGGGSGGLWLYHRYEAKYHPLDYTAAGSGDVTVQVMSGDTAFTLAPRLLQLGVIASDRAFENAAESAASTAGTNSTGLEAGYFVLHHHMQASLAYAALLDPKNRVQTTVTIPEGKRVSQVLTILAKYTKIPLARFEAAAKDTAALGLPSYAGSDATGKRLAATVPYGKLEGYLFPATYAIVPHETAVQILQAMVQRYTIEAQQINIQQAAQSVGLTPDQLIIEASMVQAEAGTGSDMPKMARVILNRKANGMPYGFSSVVFYGLGEYGIDLTGSAQAAAAGLYDNTQRPGLPPTPIDNPGDAAIQAILHPVNGDWLYFVTTAIGKPTQFSATCFQGTCG
jgi:UPF0755 protein